MRTIENALRTFHGMNGMITRVWFASSSVSASRLFAPAKTPRRTVSELARWLTDALQAPELTAKLAAQGSAPVGRCGADFASAQAI